MLARVASHLFWMSRYLERAENMARILDVGQSLALVARDGPGDASMLEPLIITGSLDTYTARHQVPAGDAKDAIRDPQAVAHYLAWNAENPSSIFCCLRQSRENARAVRSDITTEMWENLNDTWLQLLQKRHQDHEFVNSAFFDWVKERSHLFRGIAHATLRRDESYMFSRLGACIERADNTARILSVKRRRTVHEKGGAPVYDEVTDYYRLSAVLRSVSAFEAYRDTYKDAVEPRRVAELLITDPALPRSLRFCFEEMASVLDRLPQTTGREARRLCNTILAQVQYADLDEIESMGLDRFLEGFLEETMAFGQALHEGFLEPK